MIEVKSCQSPLNHSSENNSISTQVLTKTAKHPAVYCFAALQAHQVRARCLSLWAETTRLSWISHRRRTSCISAGPQTTQPTREASRSDIQVSEPPSQSSVFQTAGRRISPVQLNLTILISPFNFCSFSNSVVKLWDRCGFLTNIPLFQRKHNLHCCLIAIVTRMNLPVVLYAPTWHLWLYTTEVRQTVHSYNYCSNIPWR